LTKLRRPEPFKCANICRLFLLNLFRVLPWGLCINLSPRLRLRNETQIKDILLPPRLHFNQLGKWTKTSSTLLQFGMVEKNVLQLPLRICCHYCTGCSGGNAFEVSLQPLPTISVMWDPLPLTHFSFALFMWQDLMTIMSWSSDCRFQMPFFVYFCAVFAENFRLVRRLHFPPISVEFKWVARDTCPIYVQTLPS